MKDINKVLFSLLEGIWSPQEEKEARDLEDCGEPFIATYCAYKSMQKHNIPVPEEIKPAVLGIVEDFLRP